MAKCSRCGKKGIFLKLSSTGLCSACQLLVEKELERKRAAELSLAKRLAYMSEQKQRFESVLSAIPRVKILLTEEYDPKYKDPQYFEFIHSNITEKSSREKLGKFVAIDTETTGLNPDSCGVIEVSAIRFESFVPVELFTTLIHPNGTIAERITKLTGITREMVKDAPRIQQVVPALNAFCSGYNLVGHNLDFDLPVIKKFGFDVFDKKRKFYDTLTISRKLLKAPKQKWDKEMECYIEDYDKDFDVEDYKLETLCSYYDILRDDAHRSASDCLATGLLFKHLVDEII